MVAVVVDRHGVRLEDIEIVLEFVDYPLDIYVHPGIPGPEHGDDITDLLFLFPGPCAPLAGRSCSTISFAWSMIRSFILVPRCSP